jgi:hypothetical protein
LDICRQILTSFLRTWEFFCKAAAYPAVFSALSGGRALVINVEVSDYNQVLMAQAFVPGGFRQGWKGWTTQVSGVTECDLAVTFAVTMGGDGAALW